MVSPLVLPLFPFVVLIVLIFFVLFLFVFPLHPMFLTNTFLPPPFQARPQALLVPLSCQLPLSYHLLRLCLVIWQWHQNIEPPPPLYSIIITITCYLTPP